MAQRLRRLIAMIGALLLVCSVGYAADTPINILLLGTDDLGEQVTGEEEMSRADAIYVLSLQPGTGAVKLLSIERDYLVTLPNENGVNKISTATFFGGPELCVQMVNELFGLKLTDYAQIDIPKVIEAVDVIGGLDIEIAESEVDDVNYFIDGIKNIINGIPEDAVPHVKAGLNRLSGKQLWAFIGYRDIEIDPIESNKQRNERQQRAVKAGLTKINSMSMEDAMDAVDKVLPFITTNITIGNMLDMLQVVHESDGGDFVYARSPITEYRQKRAGLHMGIVLKDAEAEKNAVHDFLFK